MGSGQGAVDTRRKVDFFACLPALILLVVAAGLEIWGQAAREWLRYDREEIANGETWRLLSGHFVHLGWSHLVLNGTGLMLIAYLVASHFSHRQWLAICLATIVGMDLGFWYLQPQLNWYVGLSGLLHGLLAAGTVNGMRRREAEFWIIGVFLLGKLIYEQLLGPLPGSEASSGGNVVVAAHLYGALSGALAGLYFGFSRSQASSI